VCGSTEPSAPPRGPRIQPRHPLHHPRHALHHLLGDHEVTLVLARDERRRPRGGIDDQLAGFAILAGERHGIVAGFRRDRQVADLAALLVNRVVRGPGEGLGRDLPRRTQRHPDRAATRAYCTSHRFPLTLESADATLLYRATDGVSSGP